MSLTTLTAGVGRTDITPPLPADLMGYVRRAEPTHEVRLPLTATSLVIDDGDERIAIVCADLVRMHPAQAASVRSAVADAIGTTPHHVLVNVSHTHAGPFVGGGALKRSGALRTIHDREEAYAQALPHLLVSSAVAAASSMEPARVGSGTGSIGLGVNRRERTAGTEGTAGTLRTILGWNPEGIRDTDVGVLRVDRSDGSPLAILVNYACHPVVVGPEDPAVNPDFPGPMRALIEDTTGATALFVQGAGGNVLPLEGFFDHSGPEVTFGRALAIEALHVAWDIDTYQTEIDRIAYGSVTPIALYRRRRVDPQPVQRVAAAGRDVDYPLKRVPTEEEIVEILEHYRKMFSDAEARGATPVELNPIDYHITWAELALAKLAEGSASPTVTCYQQALRIGDTVIATAPGEVFSEIAIAVKEGSPVDRRHTLFAGYTNGVVSYLPTADEYQYGGYEVDYCHRGYGLLEQVAPATEQIIVDTALDLLRDVAPR